MGIHKPSPDEEFLLAAKQNCCRLTEKFGADQKNWGGIDSTSIARPKCTFHALVAHEGKLVVPIEVKKVSLQYQKYLLKI